MAAYTAGFTTKSPAGRLSTDTSSGTIAVQVSYDIFVILGAKSRAILPG